MLTID